MRCCFEHGVRAFAFRFISPGPQGLLITSFSAITATISLAPSLSMEPRSERQRDGGQRTLSFSAYDLSFSPSTFFGCVPRP